MPSHWMTDCHLILLWNHIISIGIISTSPLISIIGLVHIRLRSRRGRLNELVRMGVSCHVILVTLNLTCFFMIIKIINWHCCVADWTLSKNRNILLRNVFRYHFFRVNLLLRLIWLLNSLWLLDYFLFFIWVVVILIVLSILVCIFMDMV